MLKLIQDRLRKEKPEVGTIVTLNRKVEPFLGDYVAPSSLDMKDMKRLLSENSFSEIGSLLENPKIVIAEEHKLKILSLLLDKIIPVSQFHQKSSEKIEIEEIETKHFEQTISTLISHFEIKGKSNKKLFSSVVFSIIKILLSSQ